MITVSIVTYKTDTAELARRLDSLCSEDVERIYIVDNSREDKIRRFCQNQPKVVYLANDNTGEAKCSRENLKARYRRRIRNRSFRYENIEAYRGDE